MPTRSAATLKTIRWLPKRSRIGAELIVWRSQKRRSVERLPLEAKSWHKEKLQEEVAHCPWCHQFPAGGLNKSGAYALAAPALASLSSSIGAKNSTAGRTQLNYISQKTRHSAQPKRPAISERGMRQGPQ
eukprot:s1487_g6.t1